MQILLIVLIAVAVALAAVILVKVSKPADNSKLENTADEISRRMAVVDGRLDELSRNNLIVSQTVDARLKEIREDNGKRLEEIRQTVDEKLQKTLENRLSVTFKTVSDQLESVYKQLGEMQTLAKGVDNLEKVLTNVKTRGMWGELQAERILQEILTPEQYEKNVITKKGSNEAVEFAVRLPGATEDGCVYMPIDSKFPREDYERLCDATERADAAGITMSRNALVRRLKLEAKTICEKYIDVPHTTDFAVMFLPIEGLYAEILSVPGLQESLQRESHVMVAGPTTLASLLNSLQMGFRTLAIEKRSAEVWSVLGKVKTEFGNFEKAMESVQKKLRSASSDVEKVFTRQRVMQRALKNVESVEIEEEETILIEEDGETEDEYES